MKGARLLQMGLIAMALTAAGCSISEGEPGMRSYAATGDENDADRAGGQPNAAGEDNSVTGQDPDEAGAPHSKCFQVCVATNIDVMRQGADGNLPDGDENCIDSAGVNHCCDSSIDPDCRPSAPVKSCRWFCPPAPDCQLVCTPSPRRPQCEAVGGQCGSLTAYGLICPNGYMPASGIDGECGDGAGCCLPLDLATNEAGDPNSSSDPSAGTPSGPGNYQGPSCHWECSQPTLGPCADGTNCACPDGSPNCAGVDVDPAGN